MSLADMCRLPTMLADVRITMPVLKVLAAMLERPQQPNYGLGLIRDTGLKSGTLYPVLARLVDAGWIEGSWVDAGGKGRPPRKVYRFTTGGLSSASAAVAEARTVLARPSSRHTSPKKGLVPRPLGSPA
jgi:hypothetical protein